MNPLFELLFSYGRELALACMVVAIVTYIALFRTIPTGNFRGTAAWMVVLNVFLSAKLIFYGNSQFFFEASAVIALSAVSMVMIFPGAEKYSASRPEFHTTTLTMAVWFFAFLLAATSIVALLIHPASALNTGGRMHGTTVNPQALAMICALAIPGAAYGIAKSGPFSIKGILSVGIICAIFITEYMTGSRMGFAASAIGLAIALREYITGRKAIAGIFVGGLILSILFLTYGQDISSLIEGRFVADREETRSEGWLRAWEAFIANPLFGVEPHEEAGRLMFVENFWLAAASTGGIVALVLSLIILISLVKLLLRFLSEVASGAINRGYANFYIAALVVLVGVSVFEAALLGIVATHTMLAYIYFGTGANIVSSLERARRMRLQASRRRPQQVMP
jgi:hypothetical protein